MERAPAQAVVGKTLVQGLRPAAQEPGPDLWGQQRWAGL